MGAAALGTLCCPPTPLPTPPIPTTPTLTLTLTSCSTTATDNHDNVAMDASSAVVPPSGPDNHRLLATPTRCSPPSSLSTSPNMLGGPPPLPRRTPSPTLLPLSSTASGSVSVASGHCRSDSTTATFAQQYSLQQQHEYQWLSTPLTMKRKESFPPVPCPTSSSSGISTLSSTVNTASSYTDLFPPMDKDELRRLRKYVVYLLENVNNLNGKVAAQTAVMEEARLEQGLFRRVVGELVMVLQQQQQQQQYIGQFHHHYPSTPHTPTSSTLPMPPPPPPGFSNFITTPSSSSVYSSVFPTPPPTSINSTTTNSSSNSSSICGQASSPLASHHLTTFSSSYKSNSPLQRQYMQQQVLHQQQRQMHHHHRQQRSHSLSSSSSTTSSSLTTNDMDFLGQKLESNMTLLSGGVPPPAAFHNQQQHQQQYVKKKVARCSNSLFSTSEFGGWGDQSSRMKRGVDQSTSSSISKRSRVWE